MKQLFVLCLFFMLGVSTYAQQYKYHIVKKGETVFSIAQEYNTSEETIYKLNPDARNGIKVDSKIVVPIGRVVAEDQVEFETHRVKRRETLYSLARQYGVSENDIKRYNKHLYSEELRRGEEIRIPVNLPADQQKEQDLVSEEPRNNPLRLSPREHVVLPTEGKYGIARKYNITIEELEQLNPHVDELHPGTVLVIAPPWDESKRERELYQYYVVQPKETMFRLTQRLGISADSLITLNPALAEGLKAGMVLKIPSLEPADVDPYLEDAIVNLEDRIHNYDKKTLAVMLPLHLDRIEVEDTIDNVQDQILRDGVLRLSLDFYSGVLMALDSAATLGISADVRLFDTRANRNQASMLVNSNSFQDVDVVIGPLLQSTVEAVAQKLEAVNIPVISPLTKGEVTGLDNFVQTRPTDKMLSDAMISYITSKVGTRNLVTIVDSSWTDKQREFRATFPTSKLITPREGSYIQPRQMENALVAGEENWVILDSDKVGVLSNATSYLNSVRNKYNITLFTTNRNNAFESDDISNFHLRNLNFHYPSVDRGFIDDQNNFFVAAYKKKYGMVPNTYAVRGFDITYDALLRLATSENFMESLEEEMTTQYVENKFDYRKKASGGYQNGAIYIIKVEEDMTLTSVQ